MLDIGRERAAARSLDDAVTFTEGNAEALPFADRSFDAVTIAFGIRNVPRIEQALAEAYRVLKIGGRFLCLEFSAVDVPGLRPALRLLFVQCHPGARPHRRRRCRILSLSGGIDPPLPEPASFCRHDAGGRLCAGFVPTDERRHRGAAFRLAFVISAPRTFVRLGRAGFVFAREGVFGVVDPAMVPVPARPLLRIARLFERRSTGTAETACRRRSTGSARAM